MTIRVRFLGSGDAFGSGGRFQAAILIEAAGSSLLLDCGATSLVAIKQAGIESASIGTVLVSHLHGDHFGGLPLLVLDGQFARRTDPLVIGGPEGTPARLAAAMEVFFPGSSGVARRFETPIVELAPGRRESVGGVTVEAFPALHESGAPSLSLRVEVDGTTIGYSGDTAWTEDLVEVARDADLFICESYSYDRNIPYHLDYMTLAANRARLGCRRLVLTHMGPQMLRHLDDVDVETAFDGMRIDL